MVKLVNDSLRFLLEFLIITSLCYCGFSRFDHAIFILGIGLILPIMIIVFWATYIAPKSPNRLAFLPRFIAETVVFLIGLTLIYFSGFEYYAVLLAIFVIINSFIVNCIQF
ncbi:YrdB family protein [Bartonella sp. HY328]|uniref:YrdB family protein n=1 Tax=unclassified Bartonella TaxID=2645622 RepID=UPI003965954E